MDIGVANLSDIIKAGKVYTYVKSFWNYQVCFSWKETLWTDLTEKGIFFLNGFSD